MLNTWKIMDMSLILVPSKHFKILEQIRLRTKSCGQLNIGTTDSNWSSLINQPLSGRIIDIVTIWDGNSTYDILTGFLIMEAMISVFYLLYFLITMNLHLWILPCIYFIKGNVFHIKKLRLREVIYRCKVFCFCVFFYT
jgi:hypothetical protein